MRLNAYLFCHREAIRQSWKTLWQTPWATFMTWMVIAITLFWPLLYWVLALNVKYMTSTWQQTSHVSIYAKTTATDIEIDTLVERVRQTNGVRTLSFKTSAEGLRELQQQEGLHDVLAYLPENPLPAVIEVTATPDLQTPEKMEQLLNQFRAYPFVDQVTWDKQWITRCYTLIRFASVVGQVMILLLGFAVVMIMGNTLRLMVHHRQEDVHVLKLIGASDAFIIRPFVYMGIWYGLFGGLSALVLVKLFFYGLAPVFHTVWVLFHENADALLGISMVDVALWVMFVMGLGWLSAYFFVKRQLMAIEP